MSKPKNTFAPHDHSACAGDALAYAETQCKTAGLRLTPVRRRTLEILLESHKALGAYEVLDRLAAEGFGHQPPVAYRALEFLEANGFVHRVRRLNAFVACTHPETPHRPAFLICQSCDALAETAVPAAQNAMEDVAQAMGFAIDRVNLEAIGCCPKCQTQ